MNMKRFSAFLLALIIVCLAVPFAGVSAAETKQFWVTHYNDIYAEGSGVVFVQQYSDCEWCDHYAFSPVEGKTNVFELVETSYGVGTGVGKPLAIPEGGFVYVVNSGNDYPALYEQDPVTYNWCKGKPNYTNESVNAAITNAKTWVVGDVFVIEGLDLANKALPTTTSDKNWYDEGYVCTATIAAYEEKAETSTPVENESEDEAPEAESSEVSNDDGSDKDVDVLAIVLWSIAGVAVVAVIAVVIVLVLKKKK